MASVERVSSTDRSRAFPSLLCAGPAVDPSDPAADATIVRFLRHIKARGLRSTDHECGAARGRGARLGKKSQERPDGSGALVFAACERARIECRCSHGSEACRNSWCAATDM